MKPEGDVQTQDIEVSQARAENDVGRLNDPTTRRPDMSEWKWRGVILVFSINSLCCGYDVSNVANIQSKLYEVFGQIELLPWVGLSYSLANFAVLSYARKLTHCFDLRWIFTIHVIIFVAGTSVAGAANDMTTIIVGRVIMGLGGSVLQQSIFSYLAILATPAETPGLFALIIVMWAIGLIIGGPIGSAFSENASATWRWAFFVKLPIMGVSLFLNLLYLPRRSLAPKIPVLSRLAKVDPIGVLFNIAVPVLFALATTFSGPIWEWGSASSTAVWVIFGVSLIAWIAQQYFCIFTTAEQRAIPMHILPRWDLIPIWIASGCSGASYAVTLYYTPLFFAFARGHGAIQQTVRLLPFVLPFIVTVIFIGAILPAMGRYKIIYLFAGIFTLAGAASIAATLDESVSEAQILGIESLIGIGLGMHWQHGLGISNIINKTEKDRIDSVVVCNMMQMGGIVVSLSIAGAVFHNVGYNMLRDAIGGTSAYSEQDIREALAGVSSAVWQNREPEVISRGIHAVAEVISQQFYIVVSSGATCLICAILMSGEKLDYGRPVKKSKVAANSVDTESAEEKSM